MTTNEEEYAWYKDTNEYGGMYVTSDGFHVMVVVSPAFEYLSLNDAEAMGNAILLLVKQIRES